MNQKHKSVLDLEAGVTKIGVVGLGYVGLPLAVAFAKKYQVVGYDISEKKVELLKQGIDPTKEVADTSMLKHRNISFSADPSVLRECHAIIIAVPTPVDSGNKPDLGPVLSASRLVGANLANGKVYICYESTVYPGCTEEDCISELEKTSGKKAGADFFVGYSPERINPGDAVHRFETIKKIVSGCCEDSLDFFTDLYSSVVTAGVHRASSIRVAEAAKVIENTQRDLNIALVNELAVIFSRMGIDTREVLEAAGTKWNFLPFVPGLVGGHCIGVDPYYLTYKAETCGYIPRVILAGRALNDSMGSFVAQEVVKRTIKNAPKNGRRYEALILGVTFKENVPDVRNSKVVDIVKELREFGFGVDVVDPVGDREDAHHEYGIAVGAAPSQELSEYDSVIVAVAHSVFTEFFSEVQRGALGERPVVLADIKGLMSSSDRKALPAHVSYWRL